MPFELVEMAGARAAACLLPDGTTGTPDGKGSCLFACAVGDVVTQGGRLTSITPKASCCPACDEGAPCAAQPCPFPWLVVILTGLIAYSAGR